MKAESILWINSCCVTSTGLSLYLETLKNMEKPGIWEFRQKKTWKNLEFSIILSCIIVKLRFKKKSLSFFNFFCHHQNFYMLKNINKAALLYLFNVFIQFNTISYIKLNLKLKIDSKMCTFKDLEEIWNTWKNFRKTSGNFDFYNKVVYYLIRIWLEKN